LKKERSDFAKEIKKVQSIPKTKIKSKTPSKY